MKTNYIRQQGAVLLMSLVILVVLTLLGISALDSTKLETRMAANTKEDHTAFQAANAGIDQAYHHYVIKGKENDFEDLKEFPENEWSTEEIVIQGEDNIAGLQFNNKSNATIRLKKVVIPETSQRFFIIESTGRTGCVGSTCTGHQVQLTEGWSFKGAKGNSEYSDEMQKCLDASIPACQAFFEDIKTCPDDPTCTLPDAVPEDDCDETEDGIELPTYCAKIFSNIVIGLSE